MLLFTFKVHNGKNYEANVILSSNSFKRDIRSISLLTLGLFSLLTVSSIIKELGTLEKVEISKQDSVYNFNSTILKIISLGQKRTISDFLWIKTLLDSDLEHYQSNDLQSWMYLRFQTISELDPLFKENYIFGGRYLSIIKDDIKGANNLMEKGIAIYPKDYSLLEMLAFNYTFELGQYEKGYYYYDILSRLPNAPPYIKSLATKTRFQSSRNYDIAIASLKNIIENISKKDNQGLYEKVETDIRNLEIERDIDCLNKGLHNCNKVDPFGVPYKKKDGLYTPPEEYNPFKIYSNSQQN